jgi:hypothetical protein
LFVAIGSVSQTVNYNVQDHGQPPKLVILARILHTIPDTLFWSVYFVKCYSFLKFSHGKDLESLIELAKSDPNTLQKVSAELAKLTKSLVDATGSLPAYEQRRFQLV